MSTSTFNSWKSTSTKRGCRGRRGDGPANDAKQVPKSDTPLPQPYKPTYDNIEAVDNALTAHLQALAYMVRRSPNTPASLMQKARAWFAKDERYEQFKLEHQLLGGWHEFELHAAGQAVRRAMLPSKEEARMVRLYAKPDKIEQIAQINSAIDEMSAPGPTWSARLNILMRVLMGVALGVACIVFSLKQAVPTIQHAIGAFYGERYTWLAALRVWYSVSGSLFLAGLAWSSFRRTRSAAWWIKPLVSHQTADNITTFVQTMAVSLTACMNVLLAAIGPIVYQARRRDFGAAYGACCTIWCCAVAAAWLARRRRNAQFRY